jgi:2-polyprenyl-3-methyl-5-hydroxy-6-metoxy-1,4-benzoquinol methylase
MTSKSDGTANEESRKAWNANAAFWDEHIGHGNAWHLELVRPATERLLRDPRGLHVLDVGCGNGLLTRHLAALGAEVLGVDAAEGMLERARSHKTDHDARIEYRLVDCTDESAVRALGGARFDAAVAAMALMDMAEIRPLFRGLTHVLRPRATFVFAVMHPAFNNGTTQLTAERDTLSGELTYSLNVRRYLSEETAYGVAISGQPQQQPHFMRPLQSLFGAGFEAGFTLDGLEEPAFSGTRGTPGAAAWDNLPDVPPVLVARMRRAP